jgi:aminoglycoside/choline kinase family phosphotransferase
VPAVLATEPEEGWLLLDDLGARTVERDGGEADWRAAPPQLVAIQRAMEERIGELEALACPRRPLADLPGEIQRIVTEGPRLPGVSLDVSSAAAAVERTRAAVAAVGRLGLPDTLVHGDFHAGNVALSDGRTVIFDWSDAAIGNPLVDAVTWLDRIDDPAVRDRTWEAFAAAWSLPEDPDRSLHDAALTAGAAYQVVSYAGILRNLEPARRLENADGLEDYLGRLVAPAET